MVTLLWFLWIGNNLWRSKTAVYIITTNTVPSMQNSRHSSLSPYLFMIYLFAIQCEHFYAFTCVTFTLPLLVLLYIHVLKYLRQGNYKNQEKDCLETARNLIYAKTPRTIFISLYGNLIFLLLWWSQCQKSVIQRTWDARIPIL